MLSSELFHVVNRFSQRVGADPNRDCVASPAGPSRQEQRRAVIHGTDGTAQMGRGTLEAGVVRLLRHGGPASLDHLAARAQEVRKRLLRGRPTPLVCREREGPDASRETNE